MSKMTIQDENVVVLTVRLRTPGERSYAAAQWRFLGWRGSAARTPATRSFGQGRAANPNPTRGNERAWVKPASQAVSGLGTVTGGAHTLIITSKGTATGTGG